MTETNVGEVRAQDPSFENAEPEVPVRRLVLTRQLIVKVLAVLGVLILVYVLIYFGTWLAMLN